MDGAEHVPAFRAYAMLQFNVVGDDQHGLVGRCDREHDLVISDDPGGGESDLDPAGVALRPPGAVPVEHHDGSRLTARCEWPEPLDQLAPLFDERMAGA